MPRCVTELNAFDLFYDLDFSDIADILNDVVELPDGEVGATRYGEELLVKTSEGAIKLTNRLDLWRETVSTYASSIDELVEESGGWTEENIKRARENLATLFLARVPGLYRYFEPFLRNTKPWEDGWYIFG